MQINPNNPPQNVQTSIFYINDMHAQYPLMPQIKYEADTFEFSKKSNPTTDSFVMAGGDSFIGANKSKNKMVSSFLNLVGVEYSAMGNHDVDQLATFQDNLDNTKTKYVVSNMKVSGATPFDKFFEEGKIVSSTIVEKNGHKYGIIGTAPFKLNHAKQMTENQMSVGKFEETKRGIQNEVAKLQEQGIDKIIMVSHIGYANDVKIAKQVSGIDVIVGGHSHDLVKGLKAGKNLVTAPDGKPVIVTQAGQNGEYTGKLDVTFDPEGVIVAATNDVKPTRGNPKSLPAEFFEDRILGKPKPLGTVTRVDEMDGNSKVVESPYADFFCDAMRSQVGSDVVFMNSAGIRGKIVPGKVSNLDFKNLLPFENNIAKIEMTEKQMVDVLKDGAKSLKDDMLKPGILQVSGLRYKIDKQGEISDVKIQNKDGSFSDIDVKNPSAEKTHTALVYDFLLRTSEYPAFHDAKVLETYPYEDVNLEKLVSGYVGKLDRNNIQLKKDGRIENQSAAK